MLGTILGVRAMNKTGDIAVLVELTLVGAGMEKISPKNVSNIVMTDIKE